MPHYKITLTTSGGLKETTLVQIAKYFKENCDECYVMNEHGENGGNSHVEACAKFTATQTRNVTERMKRLYKKLDLEVTPHSIRVKKITHLNGAIIYTAKEIEDGAKLLALNGWSQTWIDKTIKENVKNIPHKMLKKLGTRLTQNTAGAVMYEYCIAHNLTVQCKQDYLSCLKLMAQDKYLFGSIRHVGVYQDVCALFGSGDATVAAAESALQFL